MNFPLKNFSPPWQVEFVLLAAIWGASFMFTRIATVEFGALATAGLRVGIAALMLVPLLVMRGLLPDLRTHWKLALSIGLLNSAIPFTCFTFALLWISIGLSSILNATVPLFGALVAWAWLKDRPNMTRMLGLAIGFGGVAMLAWDKVSFQPVAGGTATGWAVLACLFACACYGLAASITKRFASGIPPLVMAAGSQLGATIALAPLALYYWPEQPVSQAAWLSALTLGVLCTGSAYLLFFRLIQRAGPARTLSVTFAIPMFAVLYGVVFFGEVVTPWMVICALVIVAGTSMSSGMWGALPWPRRLDAAPK